jgi:hypothetical protein
MANAWIWSPLPFAAVSAGSTAPGFAAANVGNEHMGVVWKSEPGAASINIDLGADIPVDSGLLLGLTGAAAGWTMRLIAATAAQGPSFATSIYDSGVLPLLAGAAMPVNKRGRALWSNAEPVVARYWYILITPTPSGPVTIARIALGARIPLARNFRFGAAFGVRDLGAADFSRRGVFLPTKGAKLRSTGLTFGSAYQDEVEGYIHPLIERLGVTGPVALVTNPAADDQRQNRIYYGPMVGDLGTVFARANGYEWTASVVDLDPVLP